MSIHKVDVVRVKMESHGNADSLSIVRVSGFVVVVRTQDWKEGQLAAYIEPDMVVPVDRSEFSFLSTMTKPITNNGITGYRIRVKRLRGVMSMGLLIPAPEGVEEGQNIIEQLGIVRYEPSTSLTIGGESCKAPPGIRYHYDVESAYRYKHLFIEGERVIATEKVHGANARYCYVPEEGMFAGSRTEWKRKGDSILWWKALRKHPEIEEFCKANPDITVYAEAFGQVQDLKYGYDKGEVGIVVFDLLRNGQWIDHEEARQVGASLSWCPILYDGSWSDKLFELADGKSVVASWKNKDQIREGVVIKPVKERNNLEIGRTQLKVISNNYLERS